MNKEEFNRIVNEGIDRNKNFIVVKIDREGDPAPEIIINSKENFPKKIGYYNKAYDDNMELIKAKDTGKLIRVTDVLMTSNLNDLSWFVY